MRGDESMYRYYSTQRPVGPGTFPGKPEMIVNYGRREEAPGIGLAWGHLEYKEPLDDDAIEHYELKPTATVGRDTGLTDRNGTKIYEGDIVEFKHGGEFDAKGIYFRKYAVEFVNTFVTYGLRLRNRSVHFPFKQATATMHDVVIVGNIYDSPGLLEVCDEQSKPM